MHSADRLAKEPDAADIGLLAPVWAGTPAEDGTGDAAFLQAMLDAEAALARAQAALGQAPGSAASAITAAARVENFDLRGIALRARASGNPVIPLVADLTAAVPGDAAEFVHRGATSQDILDSAVMLVGARSVAAVLTDLRRTADVLGRLAAEHRETPMAGRTLTQHAVPTTFGLKAAGWRSLVLDSADRLAALRFPAQLGGAAGTLAAFQVLAASEARASFETLAASEVLATSEVRAAAETRASFETRAASEARASFETLAASEVLATSETQAASEARAGFEPRAGAPGSGIELAEAFARQLGLAEPEVPWHVLRTPIADLAAALAFTTGALGKIAADVLVLSRTEIGEVAEGGGGGSSAMPHKANPVRATLIAAAARQTPALAAVLFGSLAAEDERPAGAWHAEWQPLRELLRLTGGAADAAAGLVEGLRVFPHRMLDNLHRTRGLVVSERLAAELGAALGRGPAKQVLTDAADRAAKQGLSLEDALADVPELKELISGDRLRHLTDPAEYLGAAAALVDRALDRAPSSAPSPRNDL